MLVITSLTDTMAGFYYCSASYANSEMLENKVKVETYGENMEQKLMNDSLISHFFAVAITWKDAPENQSPISGKS